MNEGEPKPKSKADLVNERITAEIRTQTEKKLESLDEEALREASAEDLELERQNIADQKAKEEADTNNVRAHFRDLDPVDLHPFDLFTAQRVREGTFNGHEGEKEFARIRADVLALLEALERTGGGSQISRKVLYAYLGHLFGQRGLSADKFLSKRATQKKDTEKS